MAWGEMLEEILGVSKAKCSTKICLVTWGLGQRVWSVESAVNLGTGDFIWMRNGGMTI